MEVLEKKRSVVAHALGLVWMWHRSAIACCVGSVLSFSSSIILIGAVIITAGFCRGHIENVCMKREKVSSSKDC